MQGLRCCLSTLWLPVGFAPGLLSRCFSGRRPRAVPVWSLAPRPLLRALLLPQPSRRASRMMSIPRRSRHMGALSCCKVGILSRPVSCLARGRALRCPATKRYIASQHSILRRRAERLAASGVHNTWHVSCRCICEPRFGCGSPACRIRLGLVEDRRWQLVRQVAGGHPRHAGTSQPTPVAVGTSAVPGAALYPPQSFHAHACDGGQLVTLS